MIIRARDVASATINDVKSNLKNFGSTMNEAGKQSGIFGGILDGVFGSWPVKVAEGVLLRDMVHELIRVVKDGAVEFGIIGSEVNNVTQGLDRLAGGTATATAILDAMRKGVVGTIGDFELMQQSNKLLATGALKNADDFGTLASASRVLSREGFGPIPSIMTNVSNALETGRTRTLALMGVTVDIKGAEERYAKTLGLTAPELSHSQKLHADRIEILRALTGVTATAGAQELSLGERIEASRVAVENWVHELSSAVAASPAVNAAFDAIKNAFTEAFGNDSKAIIIEIVGWVNSFADTVRTYGPPIIRMMVDIKNQIVEIWHEVEHAWSLVPDWFKNIAKDAGLAAGAVYLTSTALHATTGTDVLGALGNVAQIWSVIGVNIGKANLVIKEWGLLLVAFKWEAFAVILGDIGAMLAAIAATPTATVALFVGLGVAVAGLVIGFINLYKAWRDGKSMWDFFFAPRSENDLDWLSKWVRHALPDFMLFNKVATDGLAAQRQSLEALMHSEGYASGMVPGHVGPMPPEPVDAANMSKFDAATEAGIAKAEQLWDEYFALTDKMAGDSIGVKLSGIQRWEDRELEGLRKGKKYNIDYWNDVAAVEELARLKKLDALKTHDDAMAAEVAKAAAEQAEIEYQVTLKSNAAIGELHSAAAATYQKTLDELNDVIAKDSLSARDQQARDILKTADTAKLALDRTDTYFQATYDNIERTTRIKLSEIGVIWDEETKNWVYTFDKNWSKGGWEAPGGMLDGAKKSKAGVDQLTLAVSGLATAFGQLGQQIGGTFGLIVTAMGPLQSQFEAMIKLREAAAASDATVADKTAYSASKYAMAAAAIGVGASLIAQSIDTSGKASRAALIAAGALQGAAVGAAIGAPYATATFGLSIAAGAGIGAIVGWIQSGKEWRQVIQDISRDFGGIRVSDDFAKMIADLEDQTGLGSAQAITTQLDQLIKMAGGLDSKNFDLFFGKLRDAFVMLGRGELSVAQTAQIMDKNFLEFAAAGTDSLGRLSDKMKEIIALDQQFGTQSKAIAAYLQQQGANALDSFVLIAGGIEEDVVKYDALKKAVDDAALAQKTAAAAGNQSEAAKQADLLTEALTAQHKAAEGATQGLEDLGLEAMAAFTAAVASGMPMAAALAKIHPALDLIKRAYQDLGIDIADTALKNLILQDTIVSGNPRLIAAIGGLAGEMVSLENMGLMNADTFAAMERTGTKMYDALLNKSIEATGGYDAVTGKIVDLDGATRLTLGQMQDFLHAAADEAAKLGIPLDENIQRYIDQSKAMGIWKDKGKSATDIMVDAMTTLVDKVQDLIDALNHVPARVHTDVTVDTHTSTDGQETNHEAHPMASGGAGHATGPMLFSTAGNEDFAFSGEGRRFSAAASSGDTTVNITIQAWDGQSVDAWLRHGGDRKIADAVTPELYGAATRLGLVR